MNGEELTKCECGWEMPAITAHIRGKGQVAGITSVIISIECPRCHRIYGNEKTLSEATITRKGCEWPV